MIAKSAVKNCGRNLALTIEWHREIERDFRRLGSEAARRIKRFVEDDLPRYPDPYQRAKPLTGALRGLWRYRVGDTRLICDITQDKDGHTVFCILAAHRGKVYSQKHTNAAQSRLPN